MSEVDPQDQYQYPISILFTERQLRDLFENMGEPVARMMNQDGGTGTHGTSCDGGVCKIDK